MSPRSPEPGGERAPLADTIAAVALALAVALVLYAAQGLRGTDQYWYVADVETIAAGRPALSNTWFPMGLLREPAGDYTAPVYHNGPLLHLVAAVHRVLPVSAYAAWIGFNLAGLIVTVLVVRAWLRRRANATVAGWVAACAALSPIGVWQAANVLRETWFGALSALALALFFLADTPRRSPVAGIVPAVLLALVLCIGALAHPMFLILLVLLGGVRTLDAVRERSLGRLAQLLPVIAALATVALFKDDWFPSSFQPDLASIIVSAIPGGTNMAWHFADVQATLDPAFLWSKLLDAAERQFAVPSLWPIYLQTNAALLAWVALAVAHLRTPRRDVPELRPLLVLGAFLGLYAAIVVLQQNHMRFQQLVAPAAFILIGHALHAWVPQRLLAVLMVPVLLGSGAVAAAMAHRLHDEALSERIDRATVASTFEGVAADDRVLFVDIDRHDPLSFVLRPTPALFIRPSLISDEAARRAIARFGPTLLVTDGAPPPYGLDGFVPVADSDTGSFGGLIVHGRRE